MRHRNPRAASAKYESLVGLSYQKFPTRPRMKDPYLTASIEVARIGMAEGGIPIGSGQ